MRECDTAPPLAATLVPNGSAGRVSKDGPRSASRAQREGALLPLPLRRRPPGARRQRPAGGCESFFTMSNSDPAPSSVPGGGAGAVAGAGLLVVL